MRRFQSPDRRGYSIHPATTNLLGDWVIVTVHGSLNSRLGSIELHFGSWEKFDPLRIANAAANTRLRHGYIEQASA